jgi:hypothetical protein
MSSKIRGELLLLLQQHSPFTFLALSVGSCLGVWPFTLPARASDP